MVEVKKDVYLSCTIDGDNDIWFMRLDLMHNDIVLSTLEFADITNEILDLVIINDEIKLYNDVREMVNDIAIGHLNRFAKEIISDNEDEKISLLFNIRAKANHQQKICGNDCIFCNPDLGDDPFPDFTFDAKFMTPKGDA